MTRRISYTATLLLLTAVGGCCNKCHRPAATCPPGAVAAPPPGASVIAAPTPAPGFAPAPQPVFPGAAAPAPAVRYYSPPPAVEAGPEVRLAPPEMPPEPAPARINPPDPQKPVIEEKPSVEPPLPPRDDDKKPTPSLPVGIPQFAYPYADQKIASGLKPMLDGLDWLKANGYRAVLHLKAPGEDDAADRRLIEKLGLKYVSLDVSPQTLTKETVAAFVKVVGDPDNRPLFVYDRDGSLAGGLWYLHFRTVDKLGDEEARTRAARLGLKADEQRTLWVAVQKYLSQLP